MSNYRNRETGNVLNDREVKLLHKNTSFTATTFNDLGYDPVFPIPQPAKSGTYKVVYRDGVTQDGNGNWVEEWAERDMTQDESDAYDLSQLPVVPESVTRYQGLIALEDAGLLTTVEAAIANAPKKTQIAFSNAHVWRRASSMISDMQAVLGMTDAEVDALFIAADAVD